MKFSQAIEQFVAWKGWNVKTNTMMGYSFELRMFCLYLRDPQVEQVTLGDILSYLNGMKALGWKQNCFTHKCAYLRNFFGYLRLKGFQVLDERLIPVPKRELNPPRVATREEYEKVLAVIPPGPDPRSSRNRAIMNLLWDTGARIGEVLSLNVKDMDYTRKRALIRTEKSRGRRPFRELFWTAETNANLQLWLEKRGRFHFLKDPEALFICAAGHHSGERIRIAGFAQGLRIYSAKAKIPNLNAHSFRHHMGHSILHQGGSTADVMNILGHVNVQSSTVYTMMMDKELEERYRKFQPHP